MRLSIKLNLNTLVASSFSDSLFSFLFDDISDLENWYDEENVTALEFEKGSLNVYTMYVFLDNESSPTYDARGGDIVNLSKTGTYIKFTCEFTNNMINRLVEFIQKGIIEVDQDGTTAMITYRLNDEKDKLTKNLTPVTIIKGSFKAPLGIKNIEIDVVNYDIDNSYNYIYIPKLKRYYYVTNIQLTTKDFTHLILQEDVLMSWKDLIKAQSAFVTRYAGATDKLLVDDRYPVKDVPTTSYVVPTNVSGASVVTLKYKMPNLPSSTEKAPNVLVVAKADVSTITPTYNDDVVAPTGSSLPDIQSKRTNWDSYYLLSIGQYAQLVHACVKNDGPASYIQSVLLLPFDLRDIYPSTSQHHLYAGDKMLGDASVWKNPQDASATDLYVATVSKGSSPYIVIADFYFDSRSGISITNNYLDYEPNTLWEIYIAFVGWVQVDAKQLYGNEILIYYTFDLDTGLSTAYIYDKTNQKTIWSGSCQIGIRLPIATSNAEELARQQQATGLNLVMGLMSSALSIGVGAYSGNAVAVMGGIMGATKTITGAVNTFNSMINKGQTTYGSSNNALYAPNQVAVRKTTHEKIIDSSEESNYARINGYPYRKYVALSTLTYNADYYLEIGAIHFDAKSYNIYNDEITEIVQLLQNGIII